jgi:hypothetical protein
MRARFRPKSTRFTIPSIVLPHIVILEMCAAVPVLPALKHVQASNLIYPSTRGNLLKELYFVQENRQLTQRSSCSLWHSNALLQLLSVLCS